MTLPLTIDWADPKSPISKHFTVHEATFLPSWSISHIPSEAEKAEIIKTAELMDQIRDFVNTPITVSCWIRPTSVNCPGSEHDKGNYNLAIGSKAMHSAHIEGAACDFFVKGHTADEVRALLVPKIDEFHFRMEDLKASSWTHCDTRYVKGGHNYFVP